MSDTFTRAIESVHRRYAGVSDGTLADYIPELTRANPDHFGIVLVTADGQRYATGDVDVPFTIQSVSKAFTYGMALDQRGPEAVAARVGVEPSGEAFNSISLDPDTGRPRNPMINAGAIAITGLLADAPDDRRFDTILDTFSRYAGRELGWDRQVYASESSTGFRNRAIANLLRSFEVIGDPVVDIVEDYFKQCSILVTADDLAVMAATLSNGGVNPHTGTRVLDDANVERVLSVMSTCGMYDYSGRWVYEVGLPAKSGVGGGVVGVLPGQFGLALYSPLLDSQGNTVRGVAAFRDLSRVFDLHLLRAPSMSAHAIRRSYPLSEVATTRGRPDADHNLLADLGRAGLVIEVQGDLFASSIERLVREVGRTPEEVHTFIVDLGGCAATDASTRGLLHELAVDVLGTGRRLLVADPAGVLPEGTFEDVEVTVTATVDDAMLDCEERLLTAAGREDPAHARLELVDFELVRDLGDHDRARLLARFSEQRFRAGDVIISQGDDADALYLLAEGAVRVVIERSDGANGGEPERIAELYPGVVFGELGLLGAGRRSATIRADTDGSCFVLTRRILMELRSSDHLIYTRIIEHLLVSSAERLRRANREAAMLRA